MGKIGGPTPLCTLTVRDRVVKSVESIELAIGYVECMRKVT